MGRSIVKTALPGIFSLLAATSLFAVDAVVDDNQDGTNANEFEAYWYYYDDNSGVKEDDRPQAAPTSEPSVINVPFVLKDRGWGTGDTKKVKEYTFTCGTDGTNKFAQMPFTYGEEWTASYGKATPYVGIGTMLAKDGASIDLTGAASVSFKIRSHKADLSVVFKVETADITKDSSFAFFQKPITVSTTWSSVITVALDTTALKQPTWVAKADKKAFNIKEVTKLAWEVPGGSNEGITSDTLDVDDIVINGYTFVSPTVAPNGPLGAHSGLFSDFEAAQYKDATMLGTYWYAYNDVAIGGNSAISRGATTVAATNRLKLDWEAGSGSDGAGTASFLEFTLGKTIRQKSATSTDSVDVQGFVGIGVNLYDSTTSTYFNVNTGKMTDGTGPGGAANSIYFEYLADGDFKYLTLEVSDKNDVGDATTPARKDSRGSGIVYYRNFLKTGPSVWKSATVKFSDLIVHDDWKGYVAIPLDLTNLAKVQFKVQGAQGQAGMMEIDNVCFPGLTVGTTRAMSRPAANAAFNASYVNGNVVINWKQTANISSGKISLINTKGAVVATTPIAAKSAIHSTISASKIPAGLYFVQLSGTNANGKAVSQRSTVSIVK